MLKLFKRKQAEMTAAQAIARNTEAYALFNILTARMNAGVVTTATAKPSRFPASVAHLKAFTVKLDLKRLDIGLAAAMGKKRGM